MSEPGGSSKSHVGDEGTQRMTRGEVNLRCYVDEEIFSSSFEDVPSRVDVVDVITWLRLIGEAGLTCFGKDIPFLPTSGFRSLHQGIVLRPVWRNTKGG